MNVAWVRMSLPPMFRTCPFLIIAIASQPANVRRMLEGPPLSGAVDTAPGAVLADIAEQKFRERHHCINVEGDWHPIDGTDRVELVTLARSADLVIIGQVNPNARPTPVWRPEEIVLSCCRPVLMVPHFGSQSRVGRRVLVAWGGSRKAVRALNDALPLISAADAGRIG